MPIRSATAGYPSLARASAGRSAPRKQNHQRGSGRLKTMIWLVIMIVGFYAGIKIVPVLFSEYQFQDALQTTARFASVNHQTPEDITKTIVQEAGKQNIPLNPEDIHITNGSAGVNISADYSVTVDLSVYQLTLNFHPSAGNKPLV